LSNSRGLKPLLREIVKVNKKLSEKEEESGRAWVPDLRKSKLFVLVGRAPGPLVRAGIGSGNPIPEPT